MRLSKRERPKMDVTTQSADLILSGPLSRECATFREIVISAAFGGEAPAHDVHQRIAAWSAAAAPNTLRAMLSDLKVIDGFQAKRGRPALPIAPPDLYLLIHERANAGAAKSSVDRLVASAVRLHSIATLPSPIDDNVRWKQREIRRADTRPQRQAFGLRLKGDVQDVIKHDPAPLSILKLLDAIPTDPAGVRDRALISAGYDAGLRRSELVRVKVEHIHRLPGGEASLFIPRSKTDQEGEGATAWLSARSAGLIAAWCDHAGIASGFVFRALSYRVSLAGHLSEGAVAKILKSRLTAFLDPLVEGGTLQKEDVEKIIRNTSAHSLRVGCDQDLFAAGVDIGAIMQGLRWTSPKQPLAYARHLAPGTSKLAAVMRQVR
jgi:integrase